MESGDGRALLYSPTAGDAPLLILPLSGGSPRPVVPCVRTRMFAAGARGIYYVPCEGGPGGFPPLRYLDLSNGQERVLGKLDVPVGTLAVSPDEQTILYDKQVSEGTDLWLIENFR